MTIYVMPETISGTYVVNESPVDFVYLKNERQLVTSAQISKEIQGLILTEIGQN